ncbi:MAG: hypothetical protein GKR94_28750 [Gammaproteobacteria bacterium]|nr:hypothetical protein [Gammaproteobacteria bacterium]
MTPTGSDLFEQIQTYLPPYLTPEQKADLFSELRKHPDNNGYYLSDHEETYLQGDGWKSFIVVDFVSRESKAVSGVILSNSCDISVDNPSTRNRSILFAPLIRLSAYESHLRQAGRSQQDINNIVGTIRRQEITHIFSCRRSRVH